MKSHIMRLSVHQLEAKPKYDTPTNTHPAKAMW